MWHPRSHAEADTLSALQVYDRICKALLHGEFNAEQIVQYVTDCAIELTGAEFGGYFRNVGEDEGLWSLTALVGADFETFQRLGHPRITPLFLPTYTGQQTIRSDDVLTDPRYGSLGGMPKGHLPLRSYLAVSVMRRDGTVEGALLFGHAEPGRFSAYTEQLLENVASLAGLAIDDAKRLSRAERDFAALKQAQESERLLLAELNHRVKNTLATIQSIAAQTVRHTPNLAEFEESFLGRLQGMALTHNILTDRNWSSASLREVILVEMTPYHAAHSGRWSARGPDVLLNPTAATSFGMVVHELTTNAVKYGALAEQGGHLDIAWTIAGDTFEMTWVESGGCPVTPPTRQGFGTRLLKNIARSFGGSVDARYEPHGLTCVFRASLHEITVDHGRFEG